MSIGIYKYENKINGKIYIGQTDNFIRRKGEHERRAFDDLDWNKEYNSIIHKAFRKYGLDNFNFEVIEECKIDELDDKEIYWISYYDSYYNGYNATKGGKRSSYFFYEEEIIEKVIELLKNTFLTHREIEAITGIENSYISKIRNGIYRKKEGEIYPLRPKNKIYPQSQIKLFCKECGKEITKSSKSGLCIDCFNKSQRKIERPSAIELAEKIVIQGFEATGREYNVSGNAIKKWCISYGIGKLKSEVAAWYIQNKDSVK